MSQAEFQINFKYWSEDGSPISRKVEEALCATGVEATRELIQHGYTSGTLEEELEVDVGDEQEVRMETVFYRGSWELKKNRLG
jgi:hypothetical protein